MGIPAHFFQIFGNYMLGNFWKLHVGKFLETICWEIFWKLYAGKFFWKLYAGNLLMETMCWEIRVDAGGFLKAVIMAQSHGIIPQI